MAFNHFYPLNCFTIVCNIMKNLWRCHSFNFVKIKSSPSIPPCTSQTSDNKWNFSSDNWLCGCILFSDLKVVAELKMEHFLIRDQTQDSAERRSRHAAARPPASRCCSRGRDINPWWSTRHNTDITQTTQNVQNVTRNSGPTIITDLLHQDSSWLWWTQKPCALFSGCLQLQFLYHVGWTVEVSKKFRSSVHNMQRMYQEDSHV